MNAKMVAAIVIASVITTSVMLTAVTSAYSTGFIPPAYKGIRIVTVPDLSKFPTVKSLHIIDRDEGKVKEINETTNIVFPPTPAPTPTPTEPSKPTDMEFWRWMDNYINNNPLCPGVPPIDVGKLCPFGGFDNNDWRIFAW